MAKHPIWNGAGSNHNTMLVIENNLVVSWLEGVVSRQEAARIIEVVRDGMGWRTPA